MAGITSSVGLVSGINTTDIIDQLMSLEAQPKTKLEDRIDETNKVKLAYTDLSTRLTSLKLTATSLKKASTFQAATATSGDDDVLSATAANGAAVGNYQFQVARLVTTQNSVTGGFSDFDKSKLGAGTITFEQGGGELSSDPPLAQLNGGAGIRRGQFRITDRSGKSAVIDLGSAVSLDDVLKKINTSLDISVKAAVSGDSITLTDLSGSTAGNLTVQDLGDGHSAADLGLVASVGGNTIAGTDINSLGPATKLDTLNDSRGVRHAATGADFQVALGGTNVQVTLGPDVKTVGDVVDAINAQGGTQLKAELVPGSNGIRLSDKAGGGRTITVTELNGSKAATDLGLLTDPAGVPGGTLDGKPVLAGMDTVLLSSLKGGAGLALGNISITDRSGASQTLDLSGAKTVQDVLDTISNASGVAVTARLKKSGNGIEIADDSGGTGNLIIADAGGATATTATDLGLAGSFDTSIAAAQGANLQRQWITENTQLKDYNGGKGVAPGSFKITGADGRTAEVDLSDGSATKLGDVITAINNKGIGVTASINANGDGLLLTDTSGGAGKIKVEEVDSTTAKDLNILGESDGTAPPPPTINGSFERTLTLTGDETLADLQQKITDLDPGVVAAIINDGSGVAPYRLSLTSRNTGKNGRVLIDTGNLTALQPTDLIKAQDAAVFLGNGDGPEPLLVTSGSNQIQGVIKGVTVELHGVSDKPVSLAITRTADGVVDQLTKFTDDFNSLVDKMNEYTKFDATTGEKGPLLGDNTVQTIEQDIYAVFSSAVSSAGSVRVAGDVGLSLGDGAKLQFDEQKFLDAYAKDPQAVETLFSKLPDSLTTDTPLTKLNSGAGVRASTLGDDFSITTKDGSTFNVALGNIATLGGVLDKINTAGGGKVKAAIADNGISIQITDTTTGTGTMKLQGLNGSTALNDLGLPAAADGIAVGSTILPVSPTQRVNAGSGLGHVLENSLARLIDPVDGAITRENQPLDTQNADFQNRIDELNKLLDSKRARLESQFANMESVLAGLQSQQQALGSLSAAVK
jgi:flagellar hook-associated protein 2